jgi:hypothetical protein
MFNVFYCIKNIIIEQDNDYRALIKMSITEIQLIGIGQTSYDDSLSSARERERERERDEYLYQFFFFRI